MLLSTATTPSVGATFRGTIDLAAIRIWLRGPVR
jgi:hypothetical protein